MFSGPFIFSDPTRKRFIEKGAKDAKERNGIFTLYSMGGQDIM
jgi:hypothetical protein